MFEVGSNIFIGNEICERPKPLMRLMANDFITYARTPFYFSIISLLLQINPPSGWYSKPYKISAFLSENLYSVFRNSSVKYLGGGAVIS